MDDDTCVCQVWTNGRAEHFDLPSHLSLHRRARLRRIIMFTVVSLVWPAASTAIEEDIEIMN